MTSLTYPLESATRKKIDRILNNLGWVTDENSNNCNVFTERAKTEAQNKKLKGKQPDYILYKSGTNNPIAIIETKKSGQDLKKALKQANSRYTKPLGISIVFVTDGSLFESHDIRTKTNLKIDDQIVTDLITEKLLLRFLDEGPKIYSPEKVSYTRRELIKIFSEANDLLREEGIREGIERFTEFSNILFLKLISEIEKDRENNGEKRILEKKYCWESFYNLPSEQMLEYINKIILPRLVNKYNDSGDVFQNELNIKNPSILKEIVDKLSKLKLLDADSDVKGDAFEYFLKNSVSVGTDLGEYFTPRHIVKLMVDLVDPMFNDTVYDPCCGTGGYLIHAFRHIKAKCNLTPETKKILEKKTIYGRELTSTAKIAKMNMIIIGDGHTNIKQMDCLKYPKKGEYNIVLTNFPFSQTTNYGSYYDITTHDANPSFLKHVIDALTEEQGRAGIIVPDGLLFDKKIEYTNIRRILLETCDVKAIIQLDPSVFKPYTGQPTCILIFEKGKSTKKVWFFDVTNDGFKKTGSKRGRPSIEDNDIPLLRQLWSDKVPSKHSFSVDIKTIKNNNYKLTMNAYKKLPKNTPTKKLGEICEPPIIGGTPPREDIRCWGGEYLWVKITDMNDKYILDTKEKITDRGIDLSSVKLLLENTLLFSFKLTIGKVAITRKKVYTNEAITGLIPRDKNDKYLIRYLYYILPKLDYTPYTQRATKGFTLNKNSIEDIDVPFPDFNIRKKIVEETEIREKKQKALFKRIGRIKEEQEEYIVKFIT